MENEQRTESKEVSFETVKAEIKEFGKNNFIEVARKKAVSEDGSTEFISVSRGYYARDGSRKFKRSITIPDDPETKAFMSEMIMNL